MLEPINKAAVHFVRSHEQIVLNGKFGDSFKFATRDNCPGGIVRIAKQDQLCARCNRGGNFRCLDGEVVSRIGRYGHGHSAG